MSSLSRSYLGLDYTTLSVTLSMRDLIAGMWTWVLRSRSSHCISSQPLGSATHGAGLRRLCSPTNMRSGRHVPMAMQRMSGRRATILISRDVQSAPAAYQVSGCYHGNMCLLACVCVHVCMCHLLSVGVQNVGLHSLHNHLALALSYLHGSRYVNNAIQASFSVVLVDGWCLTVSLCVLVCA